MKAHINCHSEETLVSEESENNRLFDAVASLSDKRKRHSDEPKVRKNLKTIDSSALPLSDIFSSFRGSIATEESKTFRWFKTLRFALSDNKNSHSEGFSPKNLMTCLLLLVFSFLPLSSYAEQGKLIKDITSTGSCAVVGMTADQARLTALQNARMNAIEQASGVRISSSSVVTDGRLAVDFIRAYSSGYIVNEKYQWHDLKQIKPDANSAPIPEYGVTITADVYIPKKTQNLGLKAEINTVLFKQGEKAKLGIRTAKDVKLAVFNIRADDKVAMLLPNPYMKEDILKAGNKFIFPGDNAAFELAMGTLEGHKTDSEAFLIAALPADYKMPFEYLFKFNEPVSFADFYALYSKIADDVEDSLIAYTVVGKQ